MYETEWDEWYWDDDYWGAPPGSGMSDDGAYYSPIFDPGYTPGGDVVSGGADWGSDWFDWGSSAPGYDGATAYDDPAFYSPIFDPTYMPGSSVIEPNVIDLNGWGDLPASQLDLWRYVPGADVAANYPDPLQGLVSTPPIPRTGNKIPPPAKPPATKPPVTGVPGGLPTQKPPTQGTQPRPATAASSMGSLLFRGFLVAVAVKKFL